MAAKTPSEPGWWWCKWGDDEQEVARVFQSVASDGLCVRFASGMDCSVLHANLTWLEPVTTPDQRRQAVEAMRGAKELCEALLRTFRDEDGAEMPVTEGHLRNLTAAIAALGGEGE